MKASALLNRCRELLRSTPLFWGVLAFAVYFHFAQFVPTIGWNAIELIIAQHLIDHGAYVMSLDYPSALPWRPLLPTLVVAAFRLTTADPIRIYQLVCGVSLARWWCRCSCAPACSGAEWPAMGRRS